VQLLRFTVLLFFIFTVSGPFCAVGAAESEPFSRSRVPGILTIIERWADIERRLFETDIIEDIDEFSNLIQLYLDSDIYRIYRLAPFSSKATFGPSAPNEIPEILTASGLVQSLRESILNGDHEKAGFISADISRNLVQAMLRDGEAVQFASGAYFRLLIVFIFFIALTALIIYLLYRALTRSLRREAEGSVFSRAVLLAQENERSRLSRELHDTIAQDLRYLSLEMNKISITDERDMREKLCADAASMQTDLIRKVRDICDYLVPPDFRFQGLPDALRRLCLDFGKRTGIECRIDISGDIKHNFLDEEKQLQIFRIVQEALTNVEKHASATEAIVILRSDPDGKLSVGISDDGMGFVIGSGEWGVGNGELRMNSVIHLGIRGMNERAAFLGGNLEIKSERGEGTLVRFQLPVKME